MYCILVITLLFGYSYSQCPAANQQICGTFPCVQTGGIFSCLCPNMNFAQSAAECGGAVLTTTVPTIIVPNACDTVTCQAGATCIPTSVNPAAYICLCPNNIIANPTCPTAPFNNNPCLAQPNKCQNGGTCVVNTISLQACCLCPTNYYGPNCQSVCVRQCTSDWCYNGGRCGNAYGKPYCSCPQNYRGRRCEVKLNTHNYVYLYHHPRW